MAGKLRSVVVSTRLSQTHRMLLEAMAREQGVTMSELMQRLILPPLREWAATLAHSEPMPS